MYSTDGAPLRTPCQHVNTLESTPYLFVTLLLNCRRLSTSLDKAQDLQADVWWLTKHHVDSGASAAETAGGHETAISGKKDVLEGGAASVAPGEVFQPEPRDGDGAEDRKQLAGGVVGAEATPQDGQQADGGQPEDNEQHAAAVEGTEAAPQDGGKDRYPEHDGGPPVVDELVEGHAEEVVGAGLAPPGDRRPRVGDDFQACIPSLLQTMSEKAEDKANDEGDGRGGTSVSCGFRCRISRSCRPGRYRFFGKAGHS